MAVTKGRAKPEAVLDDVGVKARRIRSLDDEITDTLATLKRLRGERANLLKSIIDVTADPNQGMLDFDDGSDKDKTGASDSSAASSSVTRKKAATKKKAAGSRKKAPAKKKAAKKAAAKKSASRKAPARKTSSTKKGSRVEKGSQSK